MRGSVFARLVFVVRIALNWQKTSSHHPLELKVCQQRDTSLCRISFRALAKNSKRRSMTERDLGIYNRPKKVSDARDCVKNLGATDTPCPRLHFDRALIANPKVSRRVASSSSSSKLFLGHHIFMEASVFLSMHLLRFHRITPNQKA